MIKLETVYNVCTYINAKYIVSVTDLTQYRRIYTIGDSEYYDVMDSIDYILDAINSYCNG